MSNITDDIAFPRQKKVADSTYLEIASRIMGGMMGIEDIVPVETASTISNPEQKRKSSL